MEMTLILVLICHVFIKSDGEMSTASELQILFSRNYKRIMILGAVHKLRWQSLGIFAPAAYLPRLVNIVCERHLMICFLWKVSLQSW